jgi:hypothetical protein
MSLKTLFIACTAIVLIPACVINGNKRVKGNGNIITDSRQVADFSKIKVVGSMAVTITEGATDVAITTDENILPYIVTQVENGWLVIKTKNNSSIKSSNGIKLAIATPNLSALKVTGSGNVTVEDKFTNDSKMDFDLTGSGSVTVAVHTPMVKVDVTGSGSINISGETKTTDVNIAGSGNYNGFDLKAENGDVNIAGSGSANIFAETNLKINIAGSGDVNHKGNAAVQSRVMGSGKVKKVD